LLTFQIFMEASILACDKMLALPGFPFSNFPDGTLHFPCLYLTSTDASDIREDTVHNKRIWSIAYSKRK
jgi:hypothetical protein